MVLHYITLMIFHCIALDTHTRVKHIKLQFTRKGVHGNPGHDNDCRKEVPQPRIKCGW